MDAQVQSTLSALDDLQTQSELSLLKLSEPLISAQAPNQSHDSSRASDASNASSNADRLSSNFNQSAADAQPTPSSLSADLSHYKSLFTKLRLSYTEQVTKEKFLRALVSSDSPVNALPAPNQEEVAALKKQLQDRKAEISRILEELEWKARELSRRYIVVREQREELREMPGRISKLREDMGTLRRERGSLLGPGDEEQQDPAGSGEQLDDLGLEAAVNLVETREEQVSHLNAKSDSLAEALARKEKELRRVKEELSASERSKDVAVQNAREARETREGRARGEGKGDMVDEIEEQGRWLRGVETTMKGLLQVES